MGGRGKRRERGSKDNQGKGVSFARCTAHNSVTVDIFEGAVCNPHPGHSIMSLG